MRKKVLLVMLLLSVLTMTTSCGNNDKNSNNQKAIEATVKPTNSPLPTADVDVNENSDGKSTLNNKTGGYKISYDSKKLKMNNTNSSLSFTPSDKKDKEELNLFLTITEVNNSSAKELGEQLKENYKKNLNIKATSLGIAETPADCYSITDNKKVIHTVYIIYFGEKSWYIELKCPKKYEKKYMRTFSEIINSMEF